MASGFSPEDQYERAFRLNADGTRKYPGSRLTLKSAAVEPISDFVARRSRGGSPPRRATRGSPTPSRTATKRRRAALLKQRADVNAPDAEGMTRAALGGALGRSRHGQAAGQRRRERQGRQPLRRDAAARSLHGRQRGDDRSAAEGRRRSQRRVRRRRDAADDGGADRQRRRREDAADRSAPT